MIGNTARAEQFRTRSGSEATKGSRSGYSLLGGGDCPTTVLDGDQQRHNLIAGLRAQMRAAQLECSQAKAIVRKEAQKKGREFFAALERRDAVVIEIQRLAEQLSALKKNPDRTRLERHFMDVCRDTISSGQFKAILNLAIQRTEAEK